MTRNKRLTLWSSLPPYLGGKRRLCPLIFREVDRILPRKLWPGLTFLDGFLGGGSVSLYAKAQGFRVISVDIAERSIVVGHALIQNSSVRLRREDILRVAADKYEPPAQVEQNYAPQAFTRAQARLLDRILTMAGEAQDMARQGLLRLLAVRVALLAHPMSSVRTGTIHRLSSGEYENITPSCLKGYVEGLRLNRPDRLWKVAMQINAGVFQGEAQVLKADIVKLLPTIEADIAYFDPPYPGVTSYEKEYKIIDEILEGTALPVSPFSAKDGASMIDGLFKQAAHIPVWILSLGNAEVTLGELEQKMRGYGREVRATEIRYMHKPSQSSEEKRQQNREFILVGWDSDAELIRDRAMVTMNAGGK
ncbi:MAG: DNA adenine methylase [Candidatus Eisenbacteria bacterium]|uniref:DNA adenine methylase n=1 Tax=Eiseniibacteriota bacterium TaxID=2212470 RepID=A0A948RX98_UNCEI|nr:DNA adenine methylase [Candidatus Eisenbacteria bacterium]